VRLIDAWQRELGILPRLKSSAVQRLYRTWLK
jgi:hypothetical protein